MAKTRIAVLDTETSGLPKPKLVPLSEQPHCAELGMLVVEGGEIVHEYNQLIKMPIPMPPDAGKINGITDEMLADQPVFADMFEEANGVLRSCDVVIAHNMPFDSGILNNEAERIQRAWAWPEQVKCSVQEFMFVFGRRAKLLELYAHFIGEELDQKHRAIDDCRALHAVLLKSGWYEGL